MEAHMMKRKLVAVALSLLIPLTARAEDKVPAVDAQTGAFHLDRPALLVIPRPDTDPFVFEIPPGYFVTEKDWAVIDTEFKRLQTVEATKPADGVHPFIVGVLILAGVAAGASAAVVVHGMAK